MATIKPTINYLSKEELTYECQIRGLSVGTVEEMRRDLLRALQRERSSPESAQGYPPHPYTVEEDEEACTKKLDDLQERISLMVSKDHKKIETKLWHVMCRVEALDVFSEAKPKLLERSTKLCQDFQTAVSGFSRPPGVDLLERSLQQLVSPPRTSTPSRPRAPSPVAPCSFVKPVPVYKWGLTFSGKPGTSVNAFLARAQELATARGVSEPELFASALDLFEGSALMWYRAVRDEVNSWGELAQRLREEFQPIDYDDRLLDEIKRRTQGETESIAVYFATMHAMFSRLSCGLSESARVRILLRNVLPTYQQQLALQPEGTVEELRSLCRRLESRRELSKEFRPPVSRGKSLEPDLAYVEPEVAAATVSSPALKIDSSDRKCFNCGNPGHRAIGCNAPRRLACYKCGQAGVTKRTCPKCAPSTAQPSGNARGRR